MTNRQRALLRACRRFNRAGGLEELHRLTDAMDDAENSRATMGEHCLRLEEHDVMRLSALTILTVVIIDMIDDLFPDCIEERSHRRAEAA